MNLKDLYEVFYIAAAQYKFFSAADGDFHKIDYILRQKASLNKYRKMEIRSVLSSGMRKIYLSTSNKTERSQVNSIMKHLKLPEK
jgi:hypothetical protein